MSRVQKEASRLREWFLRPEVDWDSVYTEQLPRIYNYFRFRLGRETDVEELTSRTFEKAWRARDLYRHDLAGFNTWLFRIAHNVGVDYLRNLRPQVPLESALEVVADGTPEDEISQSSDLSRLALLTANLPTREQELIALKYGAALTNRQIARLTGITESNVGTILHRLVQLLRSRW